MENKLNEQTAVTAHTAEAENDFGAVADGQVSFGKFKDATALLKAYNSLQAEFTKRCQRVKELEGALASLDKRENETAVLDTEKTPSAQQSDGVPTNVTSVDTAVVGSSLQSDKTLPREKSTGGNTTLGTAIDKTAKDEKEILKEYLKSVLTGKPTAIIMDGGLGIKTLPKAPKTIREAGAFAMELLNNKQN